MIVQLCKKLKEKDEELVYGIAAGLAVGLVYGIAVGLAIGIAAGLVVGLVTGIAVGLAFVVGIALVHLPEATAGFGVFGIFVLIALTFLLSELLFDTSPIKKGKSVFLESAKRKVLSLLEALIIMANLLIIRWVILNVNIMQVFWTILPYILKGIFWLGITAISLFILIGLVWLNSMRIEKR